MCNVLAFRYGSQPLDMTREGTYSLSSMTLNQLKGLDRPLVFTMIFGQGPPRDEPTRPRRAAPGVVPGCQSPEDPDPAARPLRGSWGRVEELAKRVPDLAMMRGGGVLLEYGEGPEAEVVVVRNPGDVRADLGRPTPRGPRPLRIELHRRGRDHVGVDADPRGEEGQGGLHQGSWGAAAGRPGGQGTRQLEGPADAGRLRRPRPQSGRGGDPRRPDLADRVVGPVDPFKPKEVDKIRAYADRGGPALLLLGNGGPTGLEEFLKSYNLEVVPGIVIDQRLNYEGKVQMVLAPTREAPPHPVSAAMDPNRYVILNNAAPIHILGEQGRRRGPRPIR